MSRLHHLAITAVDMPACAAFYDAILPILGYQSGYTSDELCVWTSTAADAPEILLYAAEGDDRTPHSHGRPVWQHAAFEVDERVTFDDLHQAAVRGGWQVLHPPQEYPDYAENCSAESYYAVFLLDPSGLRIEAAHIRLAPA